MYKDLKTENIKLRQTNEIMGQTIEELRRSVTDLKRRLAQHDNFNTPPSMKKGSGASGAGGGRPSKPRDRQNGAAGSVPKPRGGQKGHRGVTRKPKPTEFVDHTPNACPGCGSGSLSITETEERDITGVVRTVRVTTTRHTTNTCRCDSCGLEEIRPETGLPDSGSYDLNITAEVADDYACRMPFRMIADRMTRHGIPLSSGTAHNIMRRLGTSLGTPVAAIVAAIRKASILHVDETSIRLNGRNVWVWILYDPLTEHALYVIQDSRGSKILRETLGDWDGIIVCDGWTAYARYRVQPLLVAHIREAKDLWERNPGCPGALGRPEAPAQDL